MGETAPVIKFEPAAPDSGLLSQREAAQYLRMNRGKVIAFSKSGELPTVRFGNRHVLYRQSDLDRFIASRVHHGSKKDEAAGDRVSEEIAS